MTDPLDTHPNFTVVRRLAVGGMGEVLLTRFVGNEFVSPGYVVVKRTIQDHPNREHQDEMLREEGRVALRLRHDNLVDTFAVDELDAHPLLVMEYLAGRSMAQVLGAAKRKKQPVPVGVALSVLHQAACGLHFAHTLREDGTPLGLVHRDVSPANIFATFDGKVKVIDFGVAKADDSEIKTSTGILKGKLGYMSPEHAKGETLDPRSDLWSLGVVFWEMLVADRLFGGQNPAMTLYNITQGEVDSPRTRRPEIPASVEELCQCLLTKDRTMRVQSGAELVGLIEQMPEELWNGVAVGSFLSDRFPAEAEKGRREASEVAKPLRKTAVPVGLVDGGTQIGGSDDGEVPTLIVDGAHLLEMARAAGLLGPNEGPGQKRDEPATFDGQGGAQEEEVDEEAATEAIDYEEAQRAVEEAYAQARADGGRVLGSAPTVQEMPAVDVGGGVAPLPDVNLSANTKQLPNGVVPSESTQTGQTTKPAFGPGLGLGAPPRPLRDQPDIRPAADASGPQRLVRSSGPSTPAAASSGPQVPAAASQSGPFSQPPDALSGPRSASGSNRVESGSQSRRSRRRRGPSAMAVAASTFGALALVMGVGFAFVSQSRAGDTQPYFVGYPGEGGTDIVVAWPEDVPAKRQAQKFRVTVDNALLKVKANEKRITVAPQEIERLLRESNVWERAQMPRTSRQRLASALPVGIALLGLLSLAFGLPGLVLPRQAVPRGALRGLLLAGVAGAAAWATIMGALGWPGTETLAALDTVPRLQMGTPGAPVETDLPPEQQEALEKELADSIAARAKGHWKSALRHANAAKKIAPDHPRVTRALARAHQGAGNHSMAVQLFKDYLEKEPNADAKERSDIEAYLKRMKDR